MESDLELAGIGVAPEAETQEEEPLLIYPENWPAVEVFWALGNCWIICGMTGRWRGIDRPAIESTLRLMGVKRKKRGAIFDDLRAMEGAALEALNSKD